MRKQVTDYLLYRWRYQLGYGVIGLALIGLLTVSALYIPGGLSATEMESAVKSSAIDLGHFDPASVIQLPYHLLQKASIAAFGLTNLSVKLPSLLLGIASAIGILLLLKSWYRPNVAILTTILVITASQFLVLAQSGSSSIVYILWSVWLLVAALRVSRQAKHQRAWTIVLFSLAALSLYTPLGIYVLIALAGATMLHPHLRYLVKRAMRARVKILVAAGCGTVLLAPLVYAIIVQPSLGLTLLGVPDAMPPLLDNMRELFNQYFNFITPSSGTLMKPIYALGPLMLIVLGVIRLVTTNYTARSYIITIWTVLLLPVLLFNPTFTTVTFVPAMILIAKGVNTLLGNWYRLFPKNPYARVAGLIPLTILIGGIVVSGVGRYAYGYLYDPNTAGNYSNDLRIINAELDGSANTEKTLIVAEKEQAFYSVVAANHQANMSVTTDGAAIGSTPLTIMTREAHRTTKATGPPHRIVTDNRSEQADRFYVYKTNK